MSISAPSSFKPKVIRQFLVSAIDQLPFPSPISSCNPKFGGTDSSSKLSAASMKASILRSRPASPTRPLALPVSKKRRRPLRSEEHTSELQSLMRISYAVFCLKKKKHNKKILLSTMVNNINYDRNREKCKQ